MTALSSPLVAGSKPRYEILDGLRGVAAVIVVMFHFHPDAPTSQHIFMGCCYFIMAIGLAYASMKLYDLPIRAWLSYKFLHTKNSNSTN